MNKDFGELRDNKMNSLPSIPQMALHEAAVKLARYTRQARKHRPIGGWIASFNPHSEAALRRQGVLDRSRGVTSNPFHPASIAGRCWLEGWMAWDRRELRIAARKEKLP